MFTKLAWSLLLLLAPAPASAETPPAMSVVPVPFGLPKPSLRDFGPDLEPACIPVYLNESIATGFYAPVAANVELADDLHTSIAGSQLLCGFDLGYYKPGAGLVDATVTFYANTPLDPDRGIVLAGPYVVTGLQAGMNAFHIEVAGNVLPTDVWMGVAFNDGVTGLLCFGPPSLGSSHDVIWSTPPGLPPGAATNFAGNPPANLFLGVSTSPSTKASAATWGTLKAHYR